MGSISRTPKGHELEVWQLAKPAAQYGMLGIWSLTRLRRIVRLRHEQSELLSPEGVHLLDWAIYSTFCDCVELGMIDDARAIVRGEPESSAG